jgi:hypothetical protein
MGRDAISQKTVAFDGQSTRLAAPAESNADLPESKPVQSFSHDDDV